MKDVTISSEGGLIHGEYIARVEGSPHVGQLTWKAASEGIRIADHTLVPPAIGGRGIAAQLVKALIADAREQGFRILPQCSYVAAMFDRHPEWADLRAGNGAAGED